ncbi:hypothetical protein B4N89_46975 [Embleya scabrispora]|uniref:HTH tetR-type domain-containing protein n=1 Tax=Embleya scabrispora TaxID=159449 RepID=A0A1T3NI86_9ACTN|nr:TetR/AcrR family transcriptional regulator [Embleya scabrispora]OPC76557.1 hypothetical protein B4N89_46975 [Embleya scabrispora]
MSESGRERPANGVRRSAGRPARVDREAIVRAAVAVGFDRLAMTTVADRLGVRHSTLYRYFPTRDALAAAAMDHVVEHAAWPKRRDGDWRSHLEAYAHCHFALLTDHRGLAGEIASLSVDSPAYRARVHRTVEALTARGFAAEDAILAADLVAEQALFFFLAGQGSGTDAAPGPEQAAERRRALLAVAPPGADPVVHAAMTRIVTGPPENWFARKLTTLLDGIARLAPD